MTDGLSTARIMLVIHRADIGGVERRLSILADAFEAAGISCTFVAVSGASKEPGPLAQRSVLALDPTRSRSLWRNLRRWWRLRRLISQGSYDALLTFGHHANALGALAAAGTGIRVILSEVLSPFVRHRRWWNRTAMRSYTLADVLVVQTQRMADEMRHRLPQPKRVVVIPNPLHPSTIADPPTSSRDPVILGLGRLVPQKRYQDLIAAFARIAPDFPEWRVRIIGNGPERAKLRSLAEQLGVASRVDLPGATNNPWPELRGASVLVHCAAFEGFCNTIIEGLGSGCAVIASDCPYGPREILAGGHGVLYPVGDIDALSDHLRRLLSDEPSRIALARAGHASAGRYSLEANVHLWQSLFMPTSPDHS